MFFTGDYAGDCAHSEMRYNMNDLNLTDKVINSMIEYNSGDARRIQHAMKVYEFAALMGRMEGISEKEQQVLEIAAVLHDIGIHICEQKYGNCDGRNQELEGPAVAKAILENIMGSEADEAFVGRVCYLIGHHHTYTGVTGMDYQLLIEADFLVNAFEDGPVSYTHLQTPCPRCWDMGSDPCPNHSSLFLLRYSAGLTPMYFLNFLWK